MDTWPEAAELEKLRPRFGDRRVDLLLRARELAVNPRPLTSQERAEFDRSMAPVLADLRAAGAIVPEVRYEAWEDHAGYVFAFIGPPGQTAGTQGVKVERAGWAGLRLAGLAEQVQEWEVEALAAAGRPATWPECPEHPASHPLEPCAESGERAVWRCPRSYRVVCTIGELGSSAGRQ
jgi:hypothetical protein